jgi:hypothetical protein
MFWPLRVWQGLRSSIGFWVRGGIDMNFDPETHQECLGFIRAAIATNDRQTAVHIAAVLKDCYVNGYLDRAEIWAALTQTEQQQFQELLGPPPIVPMVHWNVGDRV